MLIDVGQDDTLDEVIELIREMDFPLSKCKMLIATHADADHVQGLAKARDRLKAKTAAHPRAAAAIEAGDAVETYASITAQDFDIPMPPCKIDVKLERGRRDQGRQAEAEGLAHARAHARGSSASSSATCCSAATTSTRTAASA